MGKVKSGSKLLAALGRTKKEQMKALTPPGVKKARKSTSVKSKAPYIRGKVMGTGDFLKRREAVAGTKFPKPTKDRQALRDTVAIGAGVAAGFGVGKYDSSKKSKAKSHKQKAKEVADKAIKKQKEKKEKHHSR